MDDGMARGESVGESVVRFVMLDLDNTWEK